MKLNVAIKQSQQYTHEGAPAAHINAEQELRRSVMACMLWEDQFYESGESIAERIAKLVAASRPEFAAACAFSARTEMKLRHVPLLIVREMARLPKHKALVAKLLADVIQRPDEITEFCAIYNKDKRQPLSAQVKKGLAAAFRKFDEYALAKYNRDGAWKLRDALFLSHAKPHDAAIKYTKLERKQAEQYDLSASERLFKRLVDGELVTPDTWEVSLSGGADKKAVFERLLSEGKLGALAFIRNLRNMAESKVDEKLIADYSATVKVERVLPFRFIAAARYVPQWERMLEAMMFRCLQGAEKLKGKTILLVDVSGSMNERISAKSEMLRLDAAYGLGVLVRELSDQVEIFTFSNQVARIAPRHGFALRDAMHTSQEHSGTQLGGAIQALHTNGFAAYDRLIVITDEQSADNVPAPNEQGYVINVASYKNGIGYGKWTHIDGWSEAVISYIIAHEAE